MFVDIDVPLFSNVYLHITNVENCMTHLNAKKNSIAIIGYNLHSLPSDVDDDVDDGYTHTHTHTQNTDIRCLRVTIVVNTNPSS